MQLPVHPAGCLATLTSGGYNPGKTLVLVLSLDFKRWRGLWWWTRRPPIGGSLELASLIPWLRSVAAQWV